MIKNYLKTTVNNIKKHKFFSILNILGLSIGIASSLFIALDISEELSYDHFNENGDSMYRVTLTFQLGEQLRHTATTPAKLLGVLKTEAASIEKATNIVGWGSTSFLYEDKKSIETKAIVVDGSFLDVFTYALLHGNPDTALKEPNSVVLTNEMAIRYFGNAAEAIGKLMVVDGDSLAFKVTGVTESLPKNSYLKFTALLSRSSFPNEDRRRTWLNSDVQTFYVLKEKATISQVDQQLEAIVQKYISPFVKDYIGQDVNELRASKKEYKLTSQPLYDIHLNSELTGEFDPQGDIDYVYTLLAIGLFLLVIASINFMNLSTAKSANRAKEVGLRKTMGSTRKQLIMQFLTESMVYSILSALIALVLVFLFLPSYNLLTGKFLTMGSLLQPHIMAIFGCSVLLVGILAGSYPAFYLTSFEVVDVIKGAVSTGSKNTSVRGALVTFQFWISIVLIISTAIVYKQLEFTQSKKIGIDKDRVLYVISAFRLGNNAGVYKTSLERFPEIEAMSHMNRLYPKVAKRSMYSSKGDENDHLLVTYIADHDLQKVMGFELIEGRYFSPDYEKDSLAVVVNEATVKEMGWSNPLEAIITQPSKKYGVIERPVIGVIKDFNYESLKKQVRPLLIKHKKSQGGHLAIRFNGSDYQQVIDRAQQEWDKLIPNEPFEYRFMADDFDTMFHSEQRLKKLFTVLAGLAMFIAALGLFGLTAFAAEQRTKEIGIRKVLGASVWQINSLLTREFNKFVLIAFILAIYPVYYFMSGWLDNFAYRISIGIWLFVIGGVVSLIISWMTVSFQAQKAARANPIDVLKHE